MLNRDWGRVNGSPRRVAILLGMLSPSGKATIPSAKDRSKFSMKKWQFFLDDSVVRLSDRCCGIMKKEPAHRYTKDTGRMPILATMATESSLRAQKWLKNGCNGFNMKRPVSTPMSFWTEQDVLLYIWLFGLEIPSVYGDIVWDREPEEGVDIFDAELFDRPLLSLTGVERTGCMFCGFGCHMEKSPGRFEMMKQTHPNQYDYIMRPKEQGGLNYKEIIDWINSHGKTNIKY